MINDLWSDWYYNHMQGGSGYSRAPKVNAEVSAFMQGMDKAAYVAFMPMMTELRGILSNGVYYPIRDLAAQFGNGTKIDYDTNLNWSYQDRWLKQCQEAWYAYDCLSGALDLQQTALKQDIAIWRGIDISSDANYPMNSQWLPQATHLSSMFTELSSLEGTKQHPWWTSNTYGSGLYDWKRYTSFVGPYLPSNMNWQWYCAMWRALCKLVTTPSMKIGKGDDDWRWINPLRQNNGQVYFDIDYLTDGWSSYMGSWQSLSDEAAYVGQFETEICKGSPELYNFPWSVCGCPIGTALYASDTASWQPSEYSNLPILQPIDGMRYFFGANGTWAQYYSGRGDIRNKYGEPMFQGHYLPYDLSAELSVGCDINFPNDYYKPSSFASKPSRVANDELQETKLANNLPDNICIPPLRLGAENFLAHQWLWESFLDGKHSEGSQHTGLVYAWTPFIFNRMHFYKHYSFNVGGEAGLYQDGDGWMMRIVQTPIIESWSNFQWRPVSELAVHEPVMADVGPNTLKWEEHSTYGADTPIGDRYPTGYTGVSCTFEIPLPLSVVNGVAVFDTTYLSSSGYTRQEWNELVRITESMFPRTRDDKLQELLEQLSSTYLDEGHGLIPTAERNLSSWEEQLSAYEVNRANVSADTWNTVWQTVVERVWPSDKEFDFNEGISATSAWSGTDPAPFDNYLSDWYGTYWYQNGYWNFPVQKVNGDFDGGYPGYTPWSQELDWVFNNLCGDICESKVYKDGQLCGSYYSDYDRYQMWQQLSGIQTYLSANGSYDLARAGNDLAYVGTQWPPLTCTVTTDPQTGTETSSYTIDENRWKWAIININDELESQAENWYNQSKNALGNAMLEYYYYTELADKYAYIASVSSVLDSTMLAEWQSEYGIALPYETQYWEDQIAYAHNEISSLSAEIDRLSAEYDEEYERILSSTYDDPLPDPDDLEKFLHYELDPHVSQLSTSWSASLNMLAVAPDTYDEQLSSYPDSEYKWNEQSYFCEKPVSRWPASQWPAWYMVPVKKTALLPYNNNGETILSNQVYGKLFGGYYDGYYRKPFDSFRYDANWMMEGQEAQDYFGYWGPRPSQFFGSEVSNPQRWNISVDLSVDVGNLSEGILDIQDARNLAYDNTLSVKFASNGYGSTYEAYALYIWCDNGPVVHTIDCQQGVSRWEQESTVGWNFAEGESEKAEYYAKEPVEGEDYDLPELSGSLKIEYGQQIIAALDMPTVYDTL